MAGSSLGDNLAWVVFEEAVPVLQSIVFLSVFLITVFSGLLLSSGGQQPIARRFPGS